MPSKDLRQLCRSAQRQGWTIGHSRSGHLRLIGPAGGAVIYAAGSPSDWRGLANLRARLRRCGLDLHR